MSFASQVRGQVARARAATEAVVRESVAELVAEAQRPVSQGGNMPVRSQYLRASVRVSFSGIPGIDPEARGVEGRFYAYSPSRVDRDLAPLRLGTTVYVGWTASYAALVHYRVNGRGRQWVTLAGQQWPQIVNRVAGRLARG